MIFGGLFKRELSHSNSTSQSLYKSIISTLKQERDIREPNLEESPRPRLEQEREKPQNSQKILEISSVKKPRRNAAEISMQPRLQSLRRYSEDPKETKSFFLLSFIIFIHYFACMHTHVLINPCKINLNSNHCIICIIIIPLISQSTHKKKEFKRGRNLEVSSFHVALFYDNCEQILH